MIGSNKKEQETSEESLNLFRWLYVGSSGNEKRNENRVDTSPSSGSGKLDEKLLHFSWLVYSFSEKYNNYNIN